MSRVLKKILVKRVKPINLKTKDAYLFEDEFTKLLPKSKIKILKNVYIFESKLKKIHFFRYYTKQWRMNDTRLKDKLIFFIKDSKKFLTSKKPHSVNIDKAIWAIDSRSNQYFHWLTDALQRIELASNVDKEIPFLLLPGFDKHGYVEDTMKILGLNHINLEFDKSYVVKEMILSERVSPAGNYRKDIINSGANKLLSKYKCYSIKETYEKVWISRQNAPKRKIQNFNEIENILKKNRFKIIEFENYNLNEQIHISNNCKIMGGVHGAGLTNMIFMNKNSSIIELRSEGDNKNNCFYSLSSDFNLNYYYFLGKANSNNYYEADLYIDPVKFESFLISENF